MLGSLFGVVYLLVTPPIHVPDEMRHLRRTVQIAHGGVVGGAEIPASVVRASRLVKAELEAQRRRRAATFSLDTLRRTAAIPLAPEKTVHFAGDRAMAYSPLPYLPAVLAVAAGSSAGVRPLLLLYLGRVALLVTAIALIYLAIRTTPVLRWPLCLLALLPMTSFMRSGLTADTLTVAVAFLLFALLLRLRTMSRAIALHDVAALLVVATSLALCKTGYLPLLLAVAALPPARFASDRARWQTIAVVIAVPLLVNVLWMLALGDWMSADNPRRAHPDEQLRLLAADPLRFISVLGASWLSPARLWQLADTFVGRLLMLTVRLPASLIVLALLVLLALVAGEKDAPVPRARERSLFGVAALGCLLLISAGAYLKWTAPGSALIHGIQGRYLHPIAPFLLFALLPPRVLRWRCSDRMAAALVAGVTIAGNAWGAAAIVAVAWTTTP